MFLYYAGRIEQQDIDVLESNEENQQLEVLIPTDFDENGGIDCKILHDSIAYKVSNHSILHIVVDANNSGSSFQLPFQYVAEKRENKKGHQLKAIRE